MSEFDLLSFSKSGGCGCKLSSHQLDVILSQLNPIHSDKLLSGFSKKEDAAVWELSENELMVQTTDFFLPFVKNPYDFGRISAANAISDVYAMGAKPIMALTILCWPVSKIPIEIASEVLLGAESVCRQAGIPIAGGHSIESEDPIFGFTVTGLVSKSRVKYNQGAKIGDFIQLTKPIGLGLLANALKMGVLSEDAYQLLVNTASQLNNIGIELAENIHVNAMTDVTGFGLLGHLKEMLSEGIGADLKLDDIPVLDGAMDIAKQMIYPNITTNNYNLVSSITEGLEGLDFLWLCDPQTGGGLLFCSSEPVPGIPIIGNITNTGKICLK